MDDHDCAKILRVIAEPARMKIIEVLRGGPLDVTEIGDRLGIRQYAASRHLTALREVGVVRSERRQRHVVYALAPGVEREGAVDLGCCRLDLRR